MNTATDNLTPRSCGVPVTTPWQRWCELTGARYPILQDGMGPGPTTHLAIAVAAAGGLGTVSVPSLSGDAADIRRDWTARIRKVAEQTEGSAR